MTKGIWKSRDELVKLRKIDRIFIPHKDRHLASKKTLESWKRAVERFKGWYRPSDNNMDTATDTDNKKT